MNKLLIIFSFVFALAMILLVFPDGAVAVLIAAAIATATILLIRRFYEAEAEFLTQVFLVALFARLTFGIIIQTFELRDFFGGDAITYDSHGTKLLEIWLGQVSPDALESRIALNAGASGWGMNYLVGFLYFFTGRNIFAAQSFCAVIGAATAPLVYGCAYQMFGNRRVGKISALLIALYPAFVIWSAQLLKDGLIIFLLVLAITMVLQLQKKLSYPAVGLLIFALLGIFSLRFYIFYMVVAAVLGTFIVGISNSSQSVFRRLVVLVMVGLGLTYLGVVKNAGENFDKFVNLEKVQSSRSDLASVGSGFGEDLDVSTTEGAITAIPVGFTYLMFAPFPWQATNFRQVLTMPEVLLWWASMPLMVYGLWFTIRHRLRASLAILIFTLMLTLAYSIFQGNVGTAYRQRTQIQVFLFIFIAVGWTLMRENKENQRALRQAGNRRIA